MSVTLMLPEIDFAVSRVFTGAVMLYSDGDVHVAAVAAKRIARGITRPDLRTSRAIDDVDLDEREQGLRVLGRARARRLDHFDGRVGPRSARDGDVACDVGDVELSGGAESGPSS